MEEHPASTRSVTMLVNGIALGTLWVIAAIGVLTTGFSWKTAALAAVTGVLTGALYAPGRHIRRVLVYVTFFAGLAISDYLWNARSTFLADVAVHAQFFAVALTAAFLTRSGVRALQSRTA